MKTALCKFCGSPVNRKRKWQEFCSDTCRWRSWATTHPRTRIQAAKEVPPCYYCGLPADTVDHIPPKTIRERLRDIGMENRYPCHEVQACHECNSALGGRPIFTLPERKRFVKAWLRRRYARVLATPPWTDSELKEIGYTLRTMILSRALMAEIIRARIAW